MAVVDTFTRTVSNGWGTSDSGGVWTVSNLGGTTADFSVSSGTGKHSHGATNGYRRSMVAGANILDPDQIIDITTPVALTGAALVTGVMARYQNDNNYYWLRLELNAGGSSIQLKISKMVGGTLTELASLNGVSGVTYGAGITMRLRARVIDDMLQVKAWRASNSEPASFQLTAYDSSFAAAGGVGVKTWLVAGNTNTLPVVPTFDSYTADENITPVVITASEQDVWPPRVLVSVTGLTVGSSVKLYRVVAGERTLLRAGDGTSVADKSFLRIDAELPFGVPVSYVALVNGSTEYSTSPVTYALPGGKVALTDAINGRSAETVILAWDEKSYDRQASVFKVGGRNVVVSGDLGMFEADIEFLTETSSAREGLADLFRGSTEGVVQIRQPGTKAYDGVDAYVAVLGMSERRWSQDGSDPRRVFTARVAEVEGWAPSLEARGFTLEDIANAYNGLTLDDLAAGYTTLLDVAQGDYS